MAPAPTNRDVRWQLEGSLYRLCCDVMDKITRIEVLYVYTDGSSLPKPRRGGVGVKYVWLNSLEEEVCSELDLDGFASATNNQMELMACIEGLRNAPGQLLPHHSRLEVRSDSRYVVDNVGRALNWAMNDWLNADGRPVENAELWRDLLKVRNKLPVRVEFKWVKGHAKDSHNKDVDKLAKRSAKGLLRKSLRVAEVRRRTVAAKTRIGSVGNKGQRLVVRIITQEYLSLQKLMKYRYEVLSPGSEYHGQVDIIFSKDFSLRRGHAYQVVLNRAENNPILVRVLREITTKPVDETQEAA